ncbi:MAG: hypothetical protein UW88_C0011G0053 [Candidatus Collierbacteria bacterium GW2011_GWD2_45_10]|uniref:DUF5659 domain-containing protein n=1 Tax=Candidatus Collierbacteria bacterium GW2011_GWB2_44_22 TaxID=1618387 RepID=A0A0G1KTW6_9BACT|nr:MAG: hypothetical protein UW31_C0006G0063 [Candidatus Collierbacteria bacterium GW2011_GWA2_44_13]KKT51344.1 MAG: hypothetical protein UW44_C0013G0064 [Candidatus Collierbacteria bacterium GW2011_GWB2_44_22]KKT88413.1 MAG: hypothetical protein UW88_C0011G0053 [Candidatus Collierbacteria bacterium GW2011_GWD2_45_10]
MTIHDYFSSSDLALVTTLSLYYPIDSLDRSCLPKIQFFFKRDSGLDKFVESYWKGELQVNPITFFNQLKIIKTRIYEH